MVLQSAFALLLSRWSHESDIVMGTPIAGRTHAAVEPLIGFFVNTLVLRTDVTENISFEKFLSQNRKSILRAYDYQDLPFEMLVEHLHVERSLSHAPLFQVLFALQNTEAIELSLPGLDVDGFASDIRQTRFDLELSISEIESGLSLGWIYADSLFEEETIERMARSFIGLLHGIVSSPGTPVYQLPLVMAEDTSQFLLWNQTEAEYPKDTCIHEQFEAQVQRTPQATAVVFEEQHLTYQQLNEQANQLADFLITQGVVADMLVGVCLERSLEMVVAILGILKAGGAYVPFDPAYPQARLAHMLEDSGVLHVVTCSRLRSRLPISGQSLLCLDLKETQDKLAGLSKQNIAKRTQQLRSSHLAYVIYTSGSTGIPKGVMIEHRSAVSFLSWVSAQYSQSELKSVLAATSICFDLSIFELFSPCLVGGKIVLVDKILDLLEEAGGLDVSLINCVPSAIKALTAHGKLPETVRTVNLAGEPLQRSVVDAIYDNVSVQSVYNLYGPSEDTTYSTFVRLKREEIEEPTIGVPLNNTRVYVLDARLNPVPVGVVGQLYLSGAGLARGYYNRPELTAKKFIDNPFSDDPTARLYQTGDLVRWLPDGRLAFLGRVDNQVKLRGFRIELGEIESVLMAQEGVHEALVMLRDQSGEQRLVAYVLANGETPGSDSFT